jgi:hypothetical protein
MSSQKQEFFALLEKKGITKAGDTTINVEKFQKAAAGDAELMSAYTNMKKYVEETVQNKVAEDGLRTREALSSKKPVRVTVTGAAGGKNKCFVGFAPFLFALLILLLLRYRIRHPLPFGFRPDVGTRSAHRAAAVGAASGIEGFERSCDGVD